MRFRSFVTIPNGIVGAFFGLLLLLGFALHRDYGVSWDEAENHENGAVNLKYVAERLAPQLARQRASYASIPPLAGYSNNDHGVAFELPLAALALVFAHHDTAAYYHLRHLLIFVVFWGGCWALYGLAWQRFRHRGWALLPVVLLVVSPRFFAEAFFNGKDIVFMAAFTLAMFTLVRLLAAPTLGRAALHALATALTIDVRVLGLLLLGFTGSMLLQPLLARPRRPWLLAGSLYLVLTSVFVVAGWPYLWEAPGAHFLWAYRHLSHYPTRISMLYFGQFITARQVPWHYLPVWLVLTTPVPYLLAALVGLGSCAGQWLRRARPAANPLDGLFVGWLLGPLLLVIGLRSTVYDGWRHLYFIYPALLLVAALGIRRVVAAARAPRPARYLALTVLLLGAAETGRTALRMVRLHPYQQVYFSFLPAPVAERLFERDYWGSSYYQGLQWLLQHRAQRGPIAVSGASRTPLVSNSLLLPPDQRARLRVVRDRARAAYFITGYRWHPQSYRDSVGQEIHTIRAGGIKILSIFERLPAKNP